MGAMEVLVADIQIQRDVHLRMLALEGEFDVEVPDEMLNRSAFGPMINAS